MLTKGAIGNLVNRYRAVLKKCNLINTFGSLAVASMLVMGGAGLAEAESLSGNNAEWGAACDAYGDSNEFTDKTFAKNSATYGGGAIYVNTDSTVTIKGGTFGGDNEDDGNTAGTSGGAIFNDATLNISKSEKGGTTFSNNKANYYGGAIYQNSSSANMTVDGADFINNSAEWYGGAICNSLGEANITSATTFSSNTSKAGGAIYNNDKMVVSDVSFSKNTVKNGDVGDGGAIFNENNGTLTITNSDFIQNEANWDAYGNGGAVANMGKLRVEISTFDGNLGGNLGGALYSGAGSNEIYVSTFKNNKALAAGAIYSKTALEVFESTFEDNEAISDNGDGGAISFSSQGKGYIVESVFRSNIAGRNGGALATHPNDLGTMTNASLDIIGGLFDKNSADDNGGAIYNSFYQSKTNADAVTVSGTEFTENNATNGGAIYNDKTNYNSAVAKMVITDATFMGNTASGSNPNSQGGGAIYNMGEVTLSGVNTFTGNKAEQAVGGAIYNRGKMTIDGAKFDSNTALYYGAIATGLTSDLTITNTEFTNNSAEAGGAVGIFKVANLDKVTFKGNKATNSSAYGGGAILLGSSSNTTFTSSIGNSFFEENTSAFDGGAIATRDPNRGNNKAAGLDLNNVTFKNNSAANHGGAFYNAFQDSTAKDGFVYVTGSTFEGNTAGKDGGAIYNSPKGSSTTVGGKTWIENSTFTGNSAVGRGGAIYNSADSEIVLSGSNVFSGNYAGDALNDIYNEGILTVDGTTTFDGGVAGNGIMKVDGTEIVLDSTAAKIENKIEGTATVSGSSKFNDQGGTLADLEEAFTNPANTTDAIKATGIAEGLISGAVDADGNRKVNTVLQDTLDIATIAPLSVGRIVMNDVRKRMGDLRDATGEAGAWMRWDGGKLKGDEGLTNNFNTIQIGADMLTGIQNVRAGVAAAFTYGDLDHNNGNGEMETYSFSAYGVWMADNGMFADVIARVGFTNTELNVKGRSVDLDNEVLSLSGEYGWRLPVCSQFYVEPQVELTYTYVTEADSKLDYATYEVDAMDSLLGRAGMAFGWKLPNDRGNLYARASVVHEFLGDAKITGSALGNTEVHETDGDDTWLEYGIGANVKLTDNTYLWADVERTEGADIDEEWRGTVGVRFSF